MSRQCEERHGLFDNGDVPFQVELVPIDNQVFGITLLRKRRQRDKPPAGDFADGFAGGTGHGIVQFVLSQVVSPEVRGREKKRPPHAERS